MWQCWHATYADLKRRLGNDNTFIFYKSKVLSKFFSRNNQNTTNDLKLNIQKRWKNIDKLTVNCKCVLLNVKNNKLMFLMTISGSIVTTCSTSSLAFY